MPKMLKNSKSYGSLVEKVVIYDLLNYSITVVSRSSVMFYHYTLIICFPMGRPPGNPREPRRNGTVLVLIFSFFSGGEGSLLGLETTKRLRWATGTYPRDLFEFWSAVNRSRPKFFRAISFRCQTLSRSFFSSTVLYRNAII